MNIWGSLARWLNRRRWKDHSLDSYPQELVKILQDGLTEQGIHEWMYARNRLLKGWRPIDVLNIGDKEPVIKAAHSFVEGYYV